MIIPIRMGLRDCEAGNGPSSVTTFLVSLGEQTWSLFRHEQNQQPTLESCGLRVTGITGNSSLCSWRWRAMSSRLVIQSYRLHWLSATEILTSTLLETVCLTD